jgi:hypothetical protein
MARNLRLCLADVRLEAFSMRNLTPYSEALCEDESFAERQLAALVTSKVYFHLGEYNESMIFALSAGKHFNIDHPGEFEDTIIGKPFANHPPCLRIVR